MSLPSHANVVIVGGGVAGCSIAYHLTKIGITDVVLLERKQLTCGTTWHAAGLVGQLRATRNLTELAKYTAELYRSLEAETGQEFDVAIFLRAETLGEVANEHPGVVHVVLDAESQLALVRRLKIISTPTTLILDPNGAEVGRAVGAPRREQVAAALHALR